jgi:hypothetical protein
MLVRATSFFYFSAVVLTAEIVATPISGLTMTGNPWIPFLASSGVEFLAVVVALLFAPETLHFKSETLHSNDSNENSSTKDTPFVETVLAKISDSLQLIKESTYFLASSLNVSLLLLVFFVATLSRQAMVLLLQYATKKYHWSYGKVNISLPPSNVDRSDIRVKGHHSSLDPGRRQPCRRPHHSPLHLPPLTSPNEIRRSNQRPLAVTRHGTVLDSRNAADVLCACTSHADHWHCSGCPWITASSHCAEFDHGSRPAQSGGCSVYVVGCSAVRGHIDCRSIAGQHVPMGDETGRDVVGTALPGCFGHVFAGFSAY